MRDEIEALWLKARPANNTVPSFKLVFGDKAGPVGDKELEWLKECERRIKEEMAVSCEARLSQALNDAFVYGTSFFNSGDKMKSTE